jgi:hypothetical protein
LNLRVSILVTVALALSSLLLVSAAGAVERTALRETVVTHGDSVFLSDLLPRGASEEMRARTAAFALGNSPLPGTHRRFERHEILRTLRGSPELAAQLIVPEAVDVMRWSQVLGREQIRTALAGRKIAGLESFGPEISVEQIEGPEEVRVTDAAAHLEVLKVVEAGASAKVRMWIPAEPKVPAFWITVHRAGDLVSAAKTGLVNGEPVDSSGVGAARPAAGVIATDAVKKGDKLELVFFATGMRITTPAQTLEVAKVGQKVRVRSLATGKVMRATLRNVAMAEVDD